MSTDNNDPNAASAENLDEETEISVGNSSNTSDANSLTGSEVQNPDASNGSGTATSPNTPPIQ